MSNPWPGANAWVVMVVRLLEIRTVNGCFVNGAFATQLNHAEPIPFNTLAYTCTSTVAYMLSCHIISIYFNIFIFSLSSAQNYVIIYIYMCVCVYVCILEMPGPAIHRPRALAGGSPCAKSLRANWCNSTYFRGNSYKERNHFATTCAQ